MGVDTVAVWVKRPKWREEAEKDWDGFVAFVQATARKKWPEAKGDVLVRSGSLFADDENEFCLTLARK